MFLRRKVNGMFQLLSIKKLSEFPRAKGQEGFSRAVSWEPLAQPALPQQLLPTTKQEESKMIPWFKMTCK